MHLKVAKLFSVRDFGQGRQSWGLGARPPQNLGRGVVGVGNGRVVKYYYILSCTGSVFESGDF